MTISELFLEEHSDEYNFMGLYNFIEERGINIEIVDFKIPAAGFATYYGIFIREELFGYIHPHVLFFIICHEIGHWLSIHKKGLGVILEKLSTDNFDELVDFVINEEILADRFALLLYYKLNGHVYKEKTQQLHLLHKRIMYKKNIEEEMFMKYPNNENSYKEYIESVIIR